MKIIINYLTILFLAIIFIILPLVHDSYRRHYIENIDKECQELTIAFQKAYKKKTIFSIFNNKNDILKIIIYFLFILFLVVAIILVNKEIYKIKAKLIMMGIIKKDLFNNKKIEDNKEISEESEDDFFLDNKI